MRLGRPKTALFSSPLQRERRSRKAKHGVRLTFTHEELVELAKFVAAGMVLLQVRPSVATRLKTALSRKKLHAPPGL